LPEGEGGGPAAQLLGAGTGPRPRSSRPDGADAVLRAVARAALAVAVGGGALQPFPAPREAQRGQPDRDRTSTPGHGCRPASGPAGGGDVAPRAPARRRGKVVPPQGRTGVPRPGQRAARRATTVAGQRGPAGRPYPRRVDATGSPAGPVSRRREG